MKIRCKNCYRILNPNEEYCTSCGEHSARMQHAMLTGDYGPDPIGKFKISFMLYLLAGFIVCGILQVVFALIENKANNDNGYTSLFCQSNSLFYSSILTFILMLFIFRKDLKNYLSRITKGQLFGSIVIAILTVAIVVILSNLTNFTLIFPKYIVDYLKSNNKVFFNLGGTSIFKIIIGSLLTGICLEVIGCKYLVDALDETMLGDVAIYFITTIVVTIFEVAWIMSIDIIIISLIINLVSTGIYMYTNRNIIINIAMRVLAVVVAIIIFVI